MPDIPPWIAINPLDTAQYYTRGLGIGNELAQTDLARERQAQSQEEHAATLAVSLQNAQRQQEEADRKAKVAGIRFAGQEAFDAEAKALEAGGSTMSADVYQNLLLKHGPRMFYDEGGAYPTFLSNLQNRSRLEEKGDADRSLREYIADQGNKNRLDVQQLRDDNALDRLQERLESASEKLDDAPAHKFMLNTMSAIRQDKTMSLPQKMEAMHTLAQRVQNNPKGRTVVPDNVSDIIPAPLDLDIRTAIKKLELGNKEDEKEIALGDPDYGPFNWDRRERINKRKEKIKNLKATGAEPAAAVSPLAPKQLPDNYTASSLANARDAIRKNPAAKPAVLNRLRAAGIDTSSLE
jgi:hypothetical protein